jgi:hypothetical protein
MTQAYPLQWPKGRPRTTVPTFSKFRVHPTSAYEDMILELDRFDAENVVVSTNIPLRMDGTPYRDGLRDAMKDPGVAVYFMRQKRLVCLCCDYYQRPWENCRAIGLSVEAFRSMERHGAHQVLDQAFEGFAALPPPGAQDEPADRHWRVVLGIDVAPGERVSAGMIHAAYKDRCREQGGATYELNHAKEVALQSDGAA